ncbi:MAG: HAMP domain-containing histidine kinase [Candidatus Thorarchaeota archaeon]|nr:MAG: HAMP domain-containing histidine kinase [Candidatus Thorarchaeota archaeon]
MSNQKSPIERAKRLWTLLTEPHSSVQGMRKRQQARLLSTLLLLAIPVFAFVQFTSELIVEATLTYLGASIAVFIIYLGTRTRYYDLSLTLTLIGFTIVPTLIFLFGTRWSPNDLPRLMVWFFVAQAGGLLLTRTLVVLLQGITMTSMMSFIVLVVFGVPFNEFDNHLGTSIIITSFLLVASYMLESYIKQLDYHRAESDLKARELEVYTQLLRHDLRNDLQAILNSIELAEMLLEISEDQVRTNLTQSLNLGNRMAQLLQIFSMPLEQPGLNLLEHIKEMAMQSQETYSNLKIEIHCTNDVQNRTFTASRLLPMVWTNIFRNSAQYCGDPSIVNVTVSVDEDAFLISISDNGPGIPEGEKEWLFKRGSNSNSGEGGVGLYLSRIVLESHNGSIHLAENKGNGAEFIVRIPFSPL